MNVNNLDFVRQHNYYEEMNFDEVDNIGLHRHLTKCSQRLRRAQNCVVGLVYEAVKRELHRSAGFVTGREYFNRLGITQSIYEAGMTIGRRVEKLPLVKFFFMNGQIEWTKLKLVSRFIEEDNQEWWLQQISELSRSQLEKLLIAKGYKPSPQNKPPHQLATLRIQEGIRKKFIDEFRVAARSNPTIKNHTLFLSKLISAWRQMNEEDKAEVCKNPDVTATDSDEGLEEQKLDAKLLKAFEASMKQVENALKKAKGDWAKIEIPRTIPKAVREYVLAATGGICAVPGCNCKVAVLHHINRYAYMRFNSPNIITGLCDGHASLIDSGKVSQVSLGLPAPCDPKAAKRIDELHRKIRNTARRKKLRDSGDWQEARDRKERTGAGTETWDSTA